MVVGEAVIVAGLGSRKGVTQTEVLAAVDAALAIYGLSRDDLDGLATAPLKRDETGLHAAATALGLQLAVIDAAGLDAVSARTTTPSDLSLATAATPSVSEAAALAAAGPAAKLLGPRLVVGPVTCAIAIGVANE